MTDLTYCLSVEHMFGKGHGDTPDTDQLSQDVGDDRRSDDDVLSDGVCGSPSERNDDAGERHGDTGAERQDGDERFDLMTHLDDASVMDRVGVVETLLAGLAHLSAEDLGSDDLLDSVRSVERLRRYADSVSCRLLAEIEARKVTDTASGLLTASWLARQAQLPAAVAKRRVRIAKKLAEDLPSVSEALADGRLGFDQAGVIADAANPRIVEQVDAATDDLCDSVHGSTFGRWKNQVRALADLLDQDGGHDPSNDVGRNHLSMSMTGQTLVLRGELTGENALIARDALNKIADQLFSQFSRDNEVTPDIEIPSRRTLLALALVEAGRRGLGSRPGRAPHSEATLILTPAGLEDPAGFPTGHGALSGAGGFGVLGGLGLIGTLDDINGSHGRNGTHGAGYLYGAGCNHHHTDLLDGTWSTGASPPTSTGPIEGSGRLGTGPIGVRPGPRSSRGFTVRNEEGVALPRSSWDVLMCDPALYSIVVDSLGVPVDMGRQVRLATQAQRRALAVRDGGCVFPGCEAPVRWTEAHHAQYWESGGPTDLRNLALLCRHHHHVAHRTGWTLEVLADGTTLWTTPMGQVFAGQQHGRTIIRTASGVEPPREPCT